MVRNITPDPIHVAKMNKKRRVATGFACFLAVAVLSGCNRAELERSRMMAAQAQAEAEKSQAEAMVQHETVQQQLDQLSQENEQLKSQNAELRKKVRSQFQGTSIFDGKSFEGWEGNMKWFRLEEGAIVAGTLNEKIPNNEFLCTTKEYGDFELRLKVKAVGEGLNAGIQFRSKRVPNHHEVSGYQADVGEKWWGKLYDESRRNKTLVGKDNSALVKVDDWNDYAIRCEGNQIQIYLNGELTVDYVEDDPEIATTGVIGLQIHGGPPCEAWYKDIVIQEL